jgi:hypothetical protein
VDVGSNGIANIVILSDAQNGVLAIHAEVRKISIFLILN